MSDRTHEQHGARSAREGLGDAKPVIEEPWSHRGPQGYRRADRCIEEDVRKQLDDEGGLDASAVVVHVSGAEVVLDGTVSSESAKQRAEDIAHVVKGVRDVQNRLSIALR